MASKFRIPTRQDITGDESFKYDMRESSDSQEGKDINLFKAVQRYAFYHMVKNKALPTIEQVHSSMLRDRVCLDASLEDVRNSYSTVVIKKKYDKYLASQGGKV